MMTTKQRLLCGTLLSVALVACSQPLPKGVYFNRGEPESLLDVSSEVINIKTDSMSAGREITNWVNQDQPTRAELRCPDGIESCIHAQKILHQFSIPVKYTPSSANTLALIYERVVARDCENRYIDNPVNPYNLNPPTFGCSTAANMVQMVSDKRQFTSPPLMDYMDAEKAVQPVGFYQQPSKYTAPNSTTDFTQLNQSAGGGSGGR